MKVGSTVRPKSPFKIEGVGEHVDIRFYANITTKEVIDEDDNVSEAWQYDEYLLSGIRNRPNLAENIENNYAAWFQLAVQKENEPMPETKREKIFRLDKETQQQGIELSEREIQETIQGRQISDLEIQILELQLGGV